MANAATLSVADFIPSADLGNATIEKQFLNARNALLTLRVPSNSLLSNKAFRAHVSGRCTTTSSITFQLRVYFGSSTTIASNTLMFDTGAQLVNGTSQPFRIHIDMAWSSDGLAITGDGTGQIANNFAGPSTLQNIVTSADPNKDANTTLASQPTYTLTATGVFGTSNAGNHATIDLFELETT